MLLLATYIRQYIRPQRKPDAKNWSVRPLLPTPLDHLPDIPRRARVVQNRVRDFAAGAAATVDDEGFPLAATQSQTCVLACLRDERC